MAVGSSKNHKGRPYAVMLLLAFSAAILGMVVLHKIREKRLFSVVVQEKEREMASLQFQLKKEKETGKELKRKFEELTATAVSLRSYRAGITHKLKEMQTLMASLRDDQRSLELAIEEKENRIKFLEEKESNATEGNLQAKALIEILKQKEAEIAEMKDRLQKPSSDAWGALLYTPSNIGPVVRIHGQGKGQNAESLLKTGQHATDKNGIAEGPVGKRKTAGRLLGSGSGRVPRNATADGEANQPVTISDKKEMPNKQRLNMPPIAD